MSQLLKELLGEAKDESQVEGGAAAEGEDEEMMDEGVELTRMAEALNTISPEDVGGNLQEQVNIVRLNRQAKINNLAHRQALLLARAKNDPLYAKYAKFNGVRLQIRELIYKKYGSKALARARQLVSSTGGPAAAAKK